MATTTYNDVRLALNQRDFDRAKELLIRCPYDLQDENQPGRSKVIAYFIGHYYQSDGCYGIALLDETQQLIRECLYEGIFTTQIFTNPDLLNMVHCALFSCKDVPHPLLEFFIEIIPEGRWKSVVHPKHNTTILDVVLSSNRPHVLIEYFPRFMAMGVPADHISNGNSTIFNVLAFGHYELLEIIEAYYHIDVNEISSRVTFGIGPARIRRNPMMEFLDINGVDPDESDDLSDECNHRININNESIKYQKRIIKNGTFDKMVHYMIGHGLNLKYRDALGHDVHWYINHYRWPTDPFTSPVGPDDWPTDPFTSPVGPDPE